MNTKYVAKCMGYFGIGDTEEKAVANMRKAGGRRRDFTIVTRNDYPDDKEGPSVDSYGNTHYYGTSCRVAEYENGKRKEIEIVA